MGEVQGRTGWVWRSAWWSRGSALAGAVALVAACGCSPLDPIGAGGSRAHWGGAAGHGGGGGQGGSTAEGTLVLDVVTVERGDFAAPLPAAGAVVAFDMPSGERVERTVGPDGRLTFEGVDWSLPASGAVTAYLEGYELRSLVGLTAESVPLLAELLGMEVLTVQLVPLAQERVVVSGIAVHMADVADSLIVTATAPCDIIATSGAGWSSHVATGQSFTLVAAEAHPPASSTVSPRGDERVFERWVELDHDAVAEDTQGIVIDMDESVAPVSVSGSYGLPDHGISTFFASASGRVRISSLGSAGRSLIGFQTWLDVAPDGSRFDYQLEHIVPEAVSRPQSLYFAARGDESSSLNIPGYPSAGEQPGVLPEPVRVAVESSSARLGETVSWAANAVDGADPTLLLQAAIADGLDDSIAWWLILPPGSTEMVLPPLPSNADPDVVLPAGPIRATIHHCEPILSPESYQGSCRRSSRSLPIEVFR